MEHKKVAVVHSLSLITFNEHGIYINLSCEWWQQAALTFHTSPSMCYSNGKIDSLRSKPNWLISLRLLLEIVSAGWMAIDRDGEAHLPPPVGVGTWCVSSSWAWPWSVPAVSKAPLSCPPQPLRRFWIVSGLPPLLWPGDLPLTCPQHLAGLQLVLLVSLCAPVGVNETVDAKNSSELWLRRVRFTCHCSSDGLFVRRGKFITYTKFPSRSKQSIHYQDISLELPPAVNYNFTYVWLIIHPVFCSLCLIRVMGLLEPVPAVAMPTLVTSGRGNQSVTEAPVNPMFMFLDCGCKLYIRENV